MCPPSAPTNSMKNILKTDERRSPSSTGLPLAPPPPAAHRLWSLDRFYWSINLGAGISYTLVSYICQYGLPGLGGEDWGFFVGYLIPCMMMALGIAVFVAGSGSYRINQPQGSAVATAVNICTQALWTRRGVKTGTPHLLDRASTKHGGTFTPNKVESVKAVTRILPFLFIFVAYWGIYSQMSTVFQNQGCQMNLDAGVKIPVSALNLFNTISILGLVPVIDSYLYPALRKRGYAVTMLDRIGWGFIFALLSMVLAALVEYYRLSEKAEPGDYYDKDARDNITPCRNLDDFNPYEYQKWEAGKGDVDEPENCHQISGCDLHYPNGAYEYLNLTCIKCDDIPQMSHLSVFWQVRLPSSALSVSVIVTVLSIADTAVLLRWRL
jgi:hypothetical protein